MDLYNMHISITLDSEIIVPEQTKVQGGTLWDNL